MQDGRQVRDRQKTRGWRQSAAVLLALGCCSWALAGDDPSKVLSKPPPGERPPTDKELFDAQINIKPKDGKNTPRVTRCVENAYTMPGQSWTTKLVEGGITLNATGKKAIPPTPKELYGRDLLPLQGSATILVLDIFDDIELLMDEDGNRQAESFFMNHGNMVVAHTLAILTASGYGLQSVIKDPNDEERSQITLRKGSSTVTIVKIPIRKAKEGDYPGQYTDQMVAQALDRVKWSGNTVLNMSFAMVPCDVAVAYDKVRVAAERRRLRYNFRWFLYFHPAAWERMRERPQKSWLLNTFLKGKVPNAFMAVAASGNYGMDDMTWPAKDEQVIGVGALAPGPAGRPWGKAAFSDKADVTVRGEWFKIPLTAKGDFNDLQDYCQKAGVCIAADIQTNTRYQDFGYRGTSFSAPSAAVYFALQGGSACRMNQGTGWSKIDANTREKELTLNPAPTCP